jgi:hypothetical protein
LQGFSEEECVLESLSAACLKWNRADEAWENVTWTISHDVKVGRPLNEDGTLRLAIWQGARSISMPDIEVIYLIELPTIRILEAIFRESRNVQAGTA